MGSGAPSPGNFFVLRKNFFQRNNCKRRSFNSCNEENFLEKNTEKVFLTTQRAKLVMFLGIFFPYGSKTKLMVKVNRSCALVTRKLHVIMFIA